MPPTPWTIIPPAKSVNLSPPAEEAAAAPSDARDDRVDDRGDGDRVRHVRAELRATGDRAGDDGRRCHREDGGTEQPAVDQSPSLRADAGENPPPPPPATPSIPKPIRKYTRTPTPT